MKRLLQDRKTLYLVLAIVVVSVFSLSIAYAAMSAVLEIHGNSEIVASSWNIHLENAERLSECNIGSATGPSISMDGNSVIFNVELNEPGECFGFTIDVVNDGSIDAMIDSVVKTPELTPEQAKYIKYDVSYENGESISTKQTLKKGTTTPIKVKLEYRKDISVSDLPSSNTSLNLSLMIVYVQSDGSGSSIPNNGTKLINVVSGDGTQVGNEICISEECFYVISSDETSITMLSKYNLYVGEEYDGETWTTYGEEATGKQDSNMLGVVSGVQLKRGTVPFSSWIYWGDTVSSYPAYVYNENSQLYEYIENYKIYLNALGVTTIEARVITYEELLALGCAGSSCTAAPEWVYSSTYWSGTANSGMLSSLNVVYYGGEFKTSFCSFKGPGCRPVITISRDYL